MSENSRENVCVTIKISPNSHRNGDINTHAHIYTYPLIIVAAAANTG